VLATAATTLGRRAVAAKAMDAGLVLAPEGFWRVRFLVRRSFCSANAIEALHHLSRLEDSHLRLLWMVSATIGSSQNPDALCRELEGLGPCREPGTACWASLVLCMFHVGQCQRQAALGHFRDFCSSSSPDLVLPGGFLLLGHGSLEAVRALMSSLLHAADASRALSGLEEQAAGAPLDRLIGQRIAELKTLLGLPATHEAAGPAERVRTTMCSGHVDEALPVIDALVASHPALAAVLLLLKGLGQVVSGNPVHEAKYACSA
jgi:hypothetical protein